MIKTRGPRSYMVADSYASEAIALNELGKPAEALPLMEQALSIYRDTVGEHHVHVAETLLSYAVILGRLGRTPEAVAKTREAVGVFRAVYGEESSYYSFALSSLGEALLHAHDKPAARIELEAAVAIFERVEMDPVIKAAAKFHLAEALIADPAQHDRAIALAKSTLAVFEAAGPQREHEVKGIKQWIAHDGKE